MKKDPCFLIVCALVLSLLPACTPAKDPADTQKPAISATDPGSTPATSGNTANVNKTGLPIVNDVITLNGLVALDVKVPDWNEHPALQEMENRTHVKIAWTCAPQDGFSEKRNLMFASNELPDLVIRAGLSAEQEIKYSTAKQIIALDPYFKDYAPHFSKLMSENESIYKNVVMPDHHVYSMPQINQVRGSLVDKYWINQTWLKNLNLQPPTTTDEFLETLRAFQSQDPNQNGAADELPFSGNKANAYELLRQFYGFWGYGKNNTIIDKYSDIDDTGTIRLIPTDPKFKEMLSFFHTMWAENLLDHEIFSQKQPQVVAKITAGTVGFVSQGNNTQWMGEKRGDFVAPPVLKGPHGDSTWVTVSPFVQTTGTFVITSANPHPEATMRWVDYLYSKEGTMLVRLGIEGKSYTKNESGGYSLLPEIVKDPTGLTQDQALAKWAFYFGGNVPQMTTDQIDLGAQQLPEMKAADASFVPFLVPANNIPQLKYTQEEIIKLGRFADDIRAFIEENCVKFITGERKLEEFDHFVKELNGMQLGEYTSIQQASFDRWKNS